MPEQVRYRTKLTQSGNFLVRYRTKILDAGMPECRNADAGVNFLDADAQLWCLEEGSDQPGMGPGICCQRDFPNQI